MVVKKGDNTRDRSNAKMMEKKASSTTAEDNDDDDDETSETSESSDSASDSGTSSSEGTSESESSETSSDDYSSSESEHDYGRKQKLRRKIQRKSSGQEIVKSTGKGRKRRLGKQAEKKPKRRRRRRRPVTICLTNCRYEIVRAVARRYKLQEVGEDEAWNIYWTDFSVSLERAMDMKRYQLVNHFPGMNEICRKDLLSRNLNRMKRMFPNEYDIFPRTWSLPADLGELQQYAHTRRNKTYICKPEMGCQGRGIFLIRNIKELNPFGKIICQLYISRPFLIDNLKFDLRIYVLITTCDPLRIYVFNEGLARFATAKYKPPTNSNTENSYMHLTNYAVNKYSRDYVVDDEGGSKRKLSAVYRWLEQRGYNTQELIENVDDVITKTIVSAHPILKHNYRTCFPHHDLCSACFEILGFDILLDYKLKPYVLEVNHSPSFHTDAQLDRDIKESLLRDTFAMLNLKQLDIHKVASDDRKRVQDRLTKRTDRKEKKDSDPNALSPHEMQLQWELEHAGGYRLIYPSAVSEKYDKFFEQNLSSLYQETAASQARAICTKHQIEEYNKLKQMEEKKRVAGNTAKAVPEKEKVSTEKVRPESPADPEKKKVVKKSKDGFSFSPAPIVAEEELDRMKLLMQRGMLIRSLGIEVQVFKLLSQLGTLKPEEERVFRRMHLQDHPVGSNAASNDPQPMVTTKQAPLTSQQLGPAALEKGEPVSRTVMNQLNVGKAQQDHTSTSSRGIKATENLTAKEDAEIKTQVNSTYIHTSRSGTMKRSTISTVPGPANNFGGSNKPHGDHSDGNTKNPYNVPYNTPAQLPGNNEILRPRVGLLTKAQPTSNFSSAYLEKLQADMKLSKSGNFGTQDPLQQYYYKSLQAQTISSTLQGNNQHNQGSNATTQGWFSNPSVTSASYLRSLKTAAATDHERLVQNTTSSVNHIDLHVPRTAVQKPLDKFPRGGQWSSRILRNDVNNNQDSTAARGLSYINTLNGPYSNGNVMMNSEPVQCTQMFFNEGGSIKGSRNSSRFDTRNATLHRAGGSAGGNATTRVAGNMALLRAVKPETSRKLGLAVNKSSPGMSLAPMSKLGDRNNLVITGVSIGRD